MHDEREPKRLFEDSEAGPQLRRDLEVASRPWSNPKRRDAALARFVATIAATSTLGIAGSAKAIWWWVAGGAALIAVGGATVVVVRSRSDEVRVEPPAVVASARPSEAPSDDAVAPTPPTADPVALAEPSAPTPPPRVRRRGPREVEPVVEPVAPAVEPVTERIARLERETMLMNDERREAQTGDARRALEIARDAEREFPRGAFAAEREAFAIVALDRLGDREAVALRGARFLELHPRSPQSAMIRRIMEH